MTLSIIISIYLSVYDKFFKFIQNMKLQEIVVSNTTSDIGEEADTNNSIGNSEEKIQHSRNITERSKEKCIILAINYIHRKNAKV